MHLPQKKIYIPLLILLIFLLIACFLFQVSKSRTFQFFGELISRVDTQEKIIAITFDDAPSASTTEEVLGILNEKNIKATFYATGENLEKYPVEARKIVEQGHELGNHSYSHQRFLFKSQSFVRDEIEKTNQLIRDAGYKDEITFRPPNGKKLFILPWYLLRNNIRTIMWDIEPDSYYQGNAELIEKYTLENVKSGSIILLHPLCNGECLADRKALPKIIDGLKAKGYYFLTIGQLLEYSKKAKD